MEIFLISWLELKYWKCSRINENENGSNKDYPLEWSKVIIW